MSTLKYASKVCFIAAALSGLVLGQSFAADSVQHADSLKHVMTNSSKEGTNVKQRAASELLKRREALVNEAMAANEEILQAIGSLEKNDKSAAFKVLTDASGKLDVVLARDPNLKLAAIDVHTYTTDLETSPKEINQVVNRAKEQLMEGHLQLGRALLSPLTSEIRILTDFLPMDTYPSAIKLASKEIQEGKPNEAAQLLSDTLSSIVTTEEIIPLPPIKAEADVLEAETLIKADKLKHRNQALALLDQANQQLEVGRLLGYGDYKVLKNEIAVVQTKINGGSSNTDVFARLEMLFHKVSSEL